MTRSEPDGLRYAPDADTALRSLETNPSNQPLLRAVEATLAMIEDGDPRARQRKWQSLPFWGVNVSTADDWVVLWEPDPEGPIILYRPNVWWRDRTRSAPRTLYDVRRRRGTGAAPRG